MALFLGVGFAFIIYAVSPWSSLHVVLLGTTFGILAAFFGSLLIPGRLSFRSSSRWRGNPARVVVASGDGWFVDFVSPSLAESLRQRGIRVSERVVVEHDLAPSVVGGFFAVALVGAVLWWYWHPDLRVINVSAYPFEIIVDGRVVALVPGQPGEVPGAGVCARIPRGRRTLQARGLDGNIVEETRAFIGQGTHQVFAPGSDGYCFAIDRKAYGNARQPRPETIQLPSSQHFHTLNESVDSWFEANPVVGSGRWFSGGVRRAVRLMRC